ncbi:hypothetical protein MRX96_047640 [Rhipicephalus microplus]
MATLVAVFIIFFHYDFASTRLVRPSSIVFSTTQNHKEGYVITWPARRGVEQEPRDYSGVMPERGTRDDVHAKSSPKDHAKRHGSLHVHATALPRIQPSTLSAPDVLYCDSAGSDALQKQLATWIDASVDPCDDFYAHTCGRWVANHSLKSAAVIGDDTVSSQALVSPRSLRLREMEARLLAELKKGTDDGSLRWPARLWEACRSPEAEPNSKEIFNKILAEHGLLGFPFNSHSDASMSEIKGSDLSTVAAKVLALSAIPAIVDVRVVKWPGIKNSKNSSTDGFVSPSVGRAHWLARIEPPEPLFLDFARMSQANDEWYLTAVDAVAGHRDQHGLFRVEQALVELAARRRGVHDYALTSVGSLAHGADWNWTQFLTVVFRGTFSVATFGRRTPVLIKGAAFERQLAALITQLGSAQLRNYLAFRMYVRYAPVPGAQDGSLRPPGAAVGGASARLAGRGPGGRRHRFALSETGDAHGSRAHGVRLLERGPARKP